MTEFRVRPTPASESSSWMSSSLQGVLLSRYSLSPPRTTLRVMQTSEKSSGKSPRVLSSVSVTSARFTGRCPVLPEKMMSSIRLPRREVGLCSPSTHMTASAMLLLPDPLGPTIMTTPGSNSSEVFLTNDLKPLISRDFRYNGAPNY